MKIYSKAWNGLGWDELGNQSEILNAHLSYKGRSVVIDYEKILHSYEALEPGIVPVEMYPYGDDVYLGFVHLDPKFKKADMSELIELLDDAIENELDPIEFPD